MSSSVTPGLIILHGNKLEELRLAVFEWLHNNPLDPLESAIYLVQSNGVAEWLKIAIAEDMGVCAATLIELPGRFLWGAYRSMLGRENVLSRAALDQSPLTWRLMRLIPELLTRPYFAPLRFFLADGDQERRLQLAERLAKLIDQYQVYRADWLNDWAQGENALRDATGSLVPLTEEQLWQAQLWQAILADLPEELRELGRVGTHLKFMAAIANGDSPIEKLPRRVVLFGVSALPQQTLEALSALSTHTQVILAIPNPCQFYWGDIIEGRELLRAHHKRQQHRGNKDLSLIPIEELHAHSHPLLASWGRLGRDFVRLLDNFDNAEATRANFSSLRIDLFSECSGNNLLERVQVAIRDLVPLADHPKTPWTTDDRSIEFHIAHSIQREVEILHDQLLRILVEKNSLRPRDIVVMVPDIESFHASIRAVFGQYPKNDPRHIPFEIGDVKDRSVNPLIVALDWLLRLPMQRCRQSEVRDLLDVPALASRFGLTPENLPQLGQWIEGAGIRWGLNQQHRNGLGLGTVGEQNSWIVGIHRMLLGYASGTDNTYAGIESYAEVGGLDASLAGSLAQFIDTLIQWRELLAKSASPAIWGTRARELMLAFFSSNDEADRLTLAQLEESLQQWLEACDDAHFVEDIPLAVLREAWLSNIDEPTINHQFVSGGVTFCSLMPMRAVPFQVVCLLGLNDADYPRRTQHVDFDLLAQAGMARPGDRSRRDDDRYLMLEALLSARSKLYISWVGRSVRDNSEQPPSVLVSQLRDYLSDGWQCELDKMTTEHPLQPFSRHYFEKDGLLTYAREWRDAHREQDLKAVVNQLPIFESEPNFRLKLSDLSRFIKQPAKYFFRHRLGVVFSNEEVLGEDEEPFSLNALEEYGVVDQLLDDDGTVEAPSDIARILEKRASRLGREGILPIGIAGEHYQNFLVSTLTPIRRSLLELRSKFPHSEDKYPISYSYDEIQVEDWLDTVFGNGDGTELVSISQNVSKMADKDHIPRPDKLINAWVSQLAAAAMGHQITGYMVARDVIICMTPIGKEEAQKTLDTLIMCWREGMNRPLPVACKTAIAFVRDEKKCSAIYDGDYQLRGEVDDVCLARLWPDFDALSEEEDWEEVARTLYAPLVDWIANHVTATAIEDNVSVEEAQ